MTFGGRGAAGGRGGSKGTRKQELCVIVRMDRPLARVGQQCNAVAAVGVLDDALHITLEEGFSEETVTGDDPLSCSGCRGVVELLDRP